jgi:ribose transport system permease protein
MKNLLKRSGSSRILLLLAVLWIAVILLFAALRPTMFSAATVTTVLQFSTILALVSLGQCLVILAGGAGIDLSVGGTVSLSVILAMLAVKAGMPPALLPIGCVLCGRCSAVQRMAGHRAQDLLPLIATLGTLFVYSGHGAGADRRRCAIGRANLAASVGQGDDLHRHAHAVLTLVVPVLRHRRLVLLLYSAWGRWLFAMGFNERSAPLSAFPSIAPGFWSTA